MVARYLKEVDTQMDDLQRGILRILGRADGTEVGMDELQRETPTNCLRIDATLEVLERLALVQETQNWLGESAYALTRQAQGASISNETRELLVATTYVSF